MVITHDEAEKKGDGEDPDNGEWDTRAQSQLDDETLEERWEQVKSILSPFMIGEEAPTEPPVDIPSIGDPSQPNIDIDIDTATQAELLGNIAQSNLAILQQLNQISSDVNPSQSLAVSSITSTDNPEEAKRILSSSPTTNKVIIKASDDNTSPLFIGTNQVTEGDGFSLKKGQSVTLELNLANASLHFVSENANEEVQILGFR